MIKEDYGYQHVCVDCNTVLESDDDVGALVVGVGLSCKECQDDFFKI